MKLFRAIEILFKEIMQIFKMRDILLLVNNKIITIDQVWFKNLYKA